MRRLAMAMTIFAAGTMAASCGGGGEGDRAAVDAYVRDANAIQRRLEPDYKRANASYVAFSQGKTPVERSAADLARARDAIRAARDRVAALRPPAAARRLHDDLIRLMDLNAGLAAETAQLAVYQQRAPRLLRPLARVDRRLRAGLRGATAGTEQAAALEGFARGLARVVSGLERLDAPPIVRPGHEQQIRRLRTTRSLAKRLRVALLAQDSPAVARLLRRFRAVGSTPQSSAVDAAAIRQYNRRFRRLNAAFQAVSREEIRLNRSLG
jgi:hypothetical protein